MLPEGVDAARRDGAAGFLANALGTISSSAAPARVRGAGNGTPAGFEEVTETLPLLRCDRTGPSNACADVAVWRFTVFVVFPSVTT